jgi:hypothetical protein
MISKPLVHVAQIVHLTCIESNTVSKQTKVRIHMTNITYEFHLVSPKWFSSLWWKPCTYLAWRLALSPNGPEWASTWGSSSRSTIGCVKNDFWAYGMFGVDRAPILHRHKYFLQMDQSEIPHNPRHLGVPSGASKMISKPMVHVAEIMHLSCTDSNTISKQTEARFYMSHVT